MADLIDRQVAIDYVDCGHLRPPTELAWSDLDVVDMLKRLPSAEPEPSQVARDIATIIENEKDMRVISERKTGRWIDDGTELGCQCSECGKSLDEYINCGTEYMTLTEIPKFCPNCGADMRKKVEHD